MSDLGRMVHEDPASFDPMITVGIPAYRNEATLARALDSVLAQTMQDFEVVVSDDTSPDATWAICEAYAARDRRIRVVRQPTNLRYMNFGFVLDQARSPYFVWLAGDDYWEPTFLEKCLAELEARPELVCCVSRCRFIRGDDSSVALGTRPLTGSWSSKVASFLRRPSDNTRMYGVFRTEALRHSFPTRHMHAYDWALSAATLRYGDHAELPETLLVRDQTDRWAYAESVQHDHRATLLRLFPVLSMSIYLLSRRQVPFSAKVLAALLYCNAVKHAEYAARYYPHYYAMLERLSRRLGLPVTAALPPAA